MEVLVSHMDGMVGEVVIGHADVMKGRVVMVVGQVDVVNWENTSSRNGPAEVPEAEVLGALNLSMYFSELGQSSAHANENKDIGAACMEGLYHVSQTHASAFARISCAKAF